MATSKEPESTGLSLEQASLLQLEDLKLEDAIQAKLDGSKSMNILIVGKHQVGKSTLINSLFYEKGQKYTRLALEGDLEPTTMEVKSFPLKVGDTTFHIYDTRGLQDGKGHDIKYIREMKKKCETVHLVIYCTKLDDPVRPEEKKALKDLKLAFGEGFWQNAVIALTFANQVEPVDPDPSITEEKFLMDRFMTKTTLLFNFFKKDLCVKPELLDKLVDRFLPAGSARKCQLPGIGDWRVGFWLGCIDACHEGAKGVVLKLAWKDPNFVRKVVGNSIATSAGAAGVVGGSGAVVAGIGLCATGVLAPVGITLIVGGVIGGLLGVGSTAGAATGLAATIRSEKKDN